MPASNATDYGQLLKNLIDRNMTDLAKTFSLIPDDFQGVDVSVTEDASSHDPKMGKAYDVVMRAPVPFSNGMERSEYGMKVRIAAGGSGSGNNIVVSMPGAVGPDGGTGSTIIVGDMVIDSSSHLRTPTGAPMGAPASTGIESAATRLVYGMFNYMATGDKSKELGDYIGPAMNNPIVNPTAGIYLPGQSRYLGQNTSDPMWRAASASRNLFYINNEEGFVDMPDKFDRLLSNVNSANDPSLSPFKNGIIKSSGGSSTFMMGSYFGTPTTDRTGLQAITYRGVLKGYLAEQRDRADPYVWNQKSGSVVPLGQYVEKKGITGFYQQAGAVRSDEETPHPGVVTNALYPVYGMFNASGTAITDLPSNVRTQLSKDRSSILYGYASSERFDVPVTRGDERGYVPNKVDLLEAIKAMNIQFSPLKSGRLFQPGKSSVVLGMDAPDGSRINQAVKSKRPMAITGRTLVLPSSLVTDSDLGKFPTRIPQEQQDAIANEFRAALGMGPNDNVTFDPGERGIGVVVQKQEFGPSAIKGNGRKLFPTIPLLPGMQAGIYDRGENGFALRSEAQTVGEGKQLGTIFEGAFAADPRRMLGVTERAFNLPENSLVSGLGKKKTPWLTKGGQVNISALGQYVAGMVGARTDGMRLITSPREEDINNYFVGEGMNPPRALDYIKQNGLSDLSDITEPIFDRDPNPQFDTTESFTATLGRKIVDQGVDGSIYSEFGIGLTEGWIPQGNVTGSTREHLVEDITRTLSQREYWSENIPSDLSGLSPEDRAFYEELSKVRDMKQSDRTAYMRDYANKLVMNNADGHPLGARIRLQQNTNTDINDEIAYTIMQKTKTVAAPSMEYRNPEYEGSAAEISMQELDQIAGWDPRIAQRLDEMKKIRSFDESIPVSKQASRAKLNVLSMAKSLSLNKANTEAFGTVFPDPNRGGSHMIATPDDVQRLIQMQSEYQNAPHDFLVAMGQDKRIGRNKGIFLPKTGIALPSPSLVAENEQMTTEFDAKTGTSRLVSMSRESVVYDRVLKEALELEAAKGRGDVVTKKQIQHVKTGLATDLLMKKGDGEDVNKDEIDMGISGRYNSSPLVPEGSIFLPNSVIRAMSARMEPGLVAALKEMDPNAEIVPGESAYRTIINRLNGTSALAVRDPNSNPSNVDENGNPIHGSMYEVSILTSKNKIGKMIQRQIDKSGSGPQGVTIHPDTTMGGDNDADPLRTFILSNLGMEKIPEGEENAGKYRFTLDKYNRKWNEAESGFIGATVGPRMAALGDKPIPQTMESLMGMFRQVKVKASEEISEADAILGGAGKEASLLTKMPGRSTQDNITLASKATEYNESKNSYMGSIYNTYLRKMQASGIGQGLGLDILGNLSNQFAGYYQKALDLELPENSPLSKILNSAVIKRNNKGGLSLNWMSKSAVIGSDGNPKIVEGWKTAAFGVNENPFNQVMTFALQSIGSDKYAPDREGVDQYVSPSALSALVTTIPGHKVFDTREEQIAELNRMNLEFMERSKENTQFFEEGLAGITDPVERSNKIKQLTETLVKQGRAGGSTILTGMIKAEMKGRADRPKTKKQKESAPIAFDLENTKVRNLGIETSLTEEFADTPLVQFLTNSFLKVTGNQYGTNEPNEYRSIDKSVEAIRIAKARGLQAHAGVNRVISNSDVNGLISVDSQGNSVNLVDATPTQLQALMEEQTKGAKEQMAAEKAQEAKEAAITSKRWKSVSKGGGVLTPPGGGGSGNGDSGVGGSVNEGDTGGSRKEWGLLGSSAQISDFLSRLQKTVSSAIVSGNTEWNRMRSETYRSELLPGSRPEEKEQAKLVLSNLLSQNEILGKTFDHAPAVMQNNPRIPRDLRNEFTGQDFLNSVISVTEGMGQENQATAFANNPELVAQAKSFKKTTKKLHNLVGKTSYPYWQYTLEQLYPDMDKQSLLELSMTSYGLGGGSDYLNVDNNAELDESQKIRIKKAFSAKAAIDLMDIGNAKDKSITESELMGMQNDYVGKGKLGKIRAMEARYGRKFLTGEAQEIKNRIIHREHAISEDIETLQTTFDGVMDINAGTSSRDLHNIAFDGIDRLPGESDEAFKKRKSDIFELRKDPNVAKAVDRIQDNRIANEYDQNLLQANFSKEKLKRSSDGYRWDAEAASAMSKNIKELSAGAASIKIATIEYKEAMREVSNKTKDFGKVLSDVTEKTSGSVTVDGQQVAMKDLTPTQYLKMGAKQRTAVQQAALESGVSQDVIDSLNIDQAQIEELQGKADKKLAKVEDAKSDNSIAGGARKLLGGFGLMYLRSMAGIISGGISAGYNEGIQSNEIMSQIFGNTIGSGYIPNNPETEIKNKLAGIGGSGMGALKSLQASWTNPTTSMLAGAVQAGIGGFALASWGAKSFADMFGQALSGSQIMPIALGAATLATTATVGIDIAGAVNNKDGTASAISGKTDLPHVMSNIPGYLAAGIDYFQGGKILDKTYSLDTVAALTGDYETDDYFKHIAGGMAGKIDINSAMKYAYGNMTLAQKARELAIYTQALSQKEAFVDIPLEVMAKASDTRAKYSLTGGDKTLLDLAGQIQGGVDPEKLAMNYANSLGLGTNERIAKTAEFMQSHLKGLDYSESESLNAGYNLTSQIQEAKSLFRGKSDDFYKKIGQYGYNQSNLFLLQTQNKWLAQEHGDYSAVEPSADIPEMSAEQFRKARLSSDEDLNRWSSIDQVSGSLANRMTIDQRLAYESQQFAGLSNQQVIAKTQALTISNSGINQILTNAQLYGGMDVSQATAYANTYQNQTMAQISLANQTLQQSGSYQASLLNLGLNGDQATMMGAIFTNQSAQERNNLLSRAGVASTVANNMVSLWGMSSSDAQKFGMEVGGMSQYKQGIYAGASQFDASSINQMIAKGWSMPGQRKLPFYMATGEIGETGYLKGKLTGSPIFTNSMGIGNPGGFTRDPVTGERVATGLTGAQVAASIFGSDWASNSTINSMVNGITLDGVSSPITGQAVQLRGLSALNFIQAQHGYEQQQVNIQQQQAGMNVNNAFTTGIGLGNYNTINPQTGQPFQLAAGGLWGVQDASMYLNWNQQEWSLTSQQRQMAMQSSQFYENMAIQKKGTEVNREYAIQNWNFQDETRDLQWGWKQEDYAENIRFMTGRQRKIADRQQKRDTIMHGIEGEQIDSQRDQQKENWKLEDERFALQKKQFEEQKKMQQESLDKQREFFEERKNLELQQRDLQRAMWVEQMALQQQSIQIQAEYAAQNFELQKITIGLQQAQAEYAARTRESQQAIQDEANTTTECAWNMWNITGEAIVAITQKAIEFKSIVENINVRSGSVAPEGYEYNPDGTYTKRATGGRFAAYEDMLVGENGPERITFDRSGSVTPGGSWNPWNQSVLNSEPSSNSSSQPINIVLNVGNQHLGKFIIDHVSNEIGI